ncbi:hypothetical protein, partial [Vibrio anguillarum]
MKKTAIALLASFAFGGVAMAAVEETTTASTTGGAAGGTAATTAAVGTVTATSVAIGGALV